MTTAVNSVDVDEIIGRPYARILEPAEEGGYTSRVLEFPGCISEGDTADEAIEMVNEALRGIVKSMLNHGDPIPPPIAAARFNGRVSLRIPPSLHARVTERADAEGISVNRLLTNAILTYLGS